MATLATALAFARAQAQTDSNGLTDTNGIIFANEALLDFRRQMIAHGVDASQIQEAYADMTGGTGTYHYPTDLFWLKAIELNYSDAVGQNYLTAQQVDVANLPNGESFGWLRTNASTGYPYFDDRGDWYEVFPTPVTSNSQGIRLFYYLTPTEFTATSDNISYPESLDYRILGWRIAASYYRSLGDSNQAASFDMEYEKKVKDVIATLSRGSQQPIIASAIPWSGWEF